MHYLPQVYSREHGMRLAHLLGATLLALGAASQAEPTSVALEASDVGTLHVAARFDASHTTRFLLDTGSAFVVLTDETRRELQRAGKLERLRELNAVMANNASVRAPVFRVSALDLGNGCVIRDFEAVALPGARKNILGLTALKRVAPFTIQFGPDRLALTCVGELADSNLTASRDANP